MITLATPMERRSGTANAIILGFGEDGDAAARKRYWLAEH
jgi:hypothetical protein